MYATAGRRARGADGAPLVSSASMSAPHSVVTRFTVRSYETDSYAHLNNGVYVSWFEHGRLEYLRSLGFSYDGFAERREWFVVARTEVDFRRPLFVAERTAMTTSIEAFGNTSVRFRQRLVVETDDGEQPAAEALTIMAFRGEAGSTPVPADFRAAVDAASV